MSRDEQDDFDWPAQDVDEFPTDAAGPSGNAPDESSTVELPTRPPSRRTGDANPRDAAPDPAQSSVRTDRLATLGGAGRLRQRGERDRDDEHGDQHTSPAARREADAYPVWQAGTRAVPRRIEPDGAQYPASGARPEQPPYAARTEQHSEPATVEAAKHAEHEQWPTGAAPDGVAAEEAGTEEAAAEGQDSAGGRRWGRVLFVATVLLVVLAAGASLALPAVSNRLALPWAPNAPRADPPEPAAIDRVLHGSLDDVGPRPSQAGVAEVLSGPLDNPDLGTLTGSVVDPATGKTLWSSEAGQPRTPASTTKLLTGAAALLTFGSDKRIPTTVVAGSEPGTVVLVGGGDPTLSSLPKGEDSIYPSAAHLDELVTQVEKATGGSVDRVAVDLTAYTGATSAQGWDPIDVPKYTAAAVPAMLDGGHTDPMAADSEFVSNPAGELLDELGARLDADVAESSSVTAPEGARVLGRVHSAPLPTLVRRSLVLSDNVLSDAIARQVAMATGNEPSFAGAAKAVVNVLSEHGFDVGDTRLADGSGLSSSNSVSPDVLTEILASAAAPADTDEATVELRPLLTSLPVARGTGTLAQRYTEQPAERGAGWVRAKTGTLTGVNTLAGTVLDSEGRLLVFAFMSADGVPDTARPALDALAAALRRCGC